MGCSSCGKRSSAMTGTGVFNAILLGTATASRDVYRVAVLDEDALKQFGVGDIVYITGEDAAAGLEDGRFELRETLFGAGAARGRLYCVVVEGEDTVCFGNISDARQRVLSSGGSISVRMK